MRTGMAFGAPARLNWLANRRRRACSNEPFFGTKETQRIPGSGVVLRYLLAALAGGRRTPAEPRCARLGLRPGARVADPGLSHRPDLLVGFRSHARGRAPGIAIRQHRTGARLG